MVVTVTVPLWDWYKYRVEGAEQNTTGLARANPAAAIQRVRRHARMRMGEDGRMREPDWEPETEKGYEVARVELKNRFAAWCADNGTEIDADPGETLIHYKWGYLDRRMTRWTSGDLDEIYLELHPAKMIIGEDELDGVLPEAKAFITFLAETGLLDPTSDPADVLLEHLDGMDGPFRKNMADTSRYSFGKRLWSTAMSEGVQLDDEQAVNAFMQDFNRRPVSERERVLGRLPTSPNRKATGRFTPPGTPPRPKQPAKRRRR